MCAFRYVVKHKIHFTYKFCGYVGAITVRIAIIIYSYVQMLNALGFALALSLEADGDWRLVLW